MKLKLKKGKLSKAQRAKIEGAILDFFIFEGGNKPYNYKQISAALGFDTISQKEAVAEVLADLAFAEALIETSPGKYKIAERSMAMMATFVRRNSGKNSAIIDQTGEVYIVEERDSMRALNGDKVKVRIYKPYVNDAPIAEVIEIVERKEQTYVGTLDVSATFGYLLTESKTLGVDIFIPFDKLNGGKTGDKAIVRITKWKPKEKTPNGEVVKILGRVGENNAEIHAILAEYGLPYSYPEEIEKAANKIEAGITSEEVRKRVDMRDVVTFTIDPRDAKDFDDALSFEKLDNGNYRVGIHIADVTHYVKPDSIINTEAEMRATSVYLVDRTIPMLPEHLSNGICSLRPDEEKLTFSCIVELDEEANVIKQKICRTVIKSNRRFTYEEAQNVIETGEGDFADELATLNSLAKKLREKRFEIGSLDFARSEVKFEIDEVGKPVGVYFKEMKEANKLIEEFMLLANKCVAEFIGKTARGEKAKPFVYRVHDNPDPEKFENLKKIAMKLGYKLITEGDKKQVNASLNEMLSSSRGKPESNLLSIVAVRAMAKAIYTTVNVGHYGLGFTHYTHFTSPIRRYPDMMVHRLLERYMSGGKAYDEVILEEKCKHSSDMEQLAASAERASIKYKQVEFLGDHLGEVFDGKVSGISERGFYVELDDNYCEGYVAIRELDDDTYVYDADNFRFVGAEWGKVYQLGDAVQVQIARADLMRKQLDFVIVNEDHPVGSHVIDSAPITFDSVKMAMKVKAKLAEQKRKSNKKWHRH